MKIGKKIYFHIITNSFGELMKNQYLKMHCDEFLCGLLFRDVINDLDSVTTVIYHNFIYLSGDGADAFSSWTYSF